MGRRVGLTRGFLVHPWSQDEYTHHPGSGKGILVLRERVSFRGPTALRERRGRGTYLENFFLLRSDAGDGERDSRLGVVSSRFRARHLSASSPPRSDSTSDAAAFICRTKDERCLDRDVCTRLVWFSALVGFISLFFFPRDLSPDLQRTSELLKGLPRRKRAPDPSYPPKVARGRPTDGQSRRGLGHCLAFSGSLRSPPRSRPVSPVIRD